MAEVKRCAKTFWTSNWSHRNCSRKGVIERDGEWYCRQHDPVAVEARRKARYEQWDKEHNARAALGLAEGEVREATAEVVRAARALVASVNPARSLGDISDALGRLDAAEAELARLKAEDR